jgi:hypothetical protein
MERRKLIMPDEISGRADAAMNKEATLDKVAGVVNNSIVMAARAMVAQDFDKMDSNIVCADLNVPEAWPDAGVGTRERLYHYISGVVVTAGDVLPQIKVMGDQYIERASIIVMNRLQSLLMVTKVVELLWKN